MYSSRQFKKEQTTSITIVYTRLVLDGWLRVLAVDRFMFDSRRYSMMQCLSYRHQCTEQEKTTRIRV